LKIIEASNSVLLIGSHQYFILQDDSGKEIAQLNGFVVGADGIPNTTGFTGTLQVRSDYGSDSSAATTKMVVFSGSQQDTMKLWNAAVQCGVAINAQNYSYSWSDSFGGHNSNSAFSTLAKCMGVADLDLGGATPGLHDIILDANTIAYIRSQVGLPATSGSSGSGGATGGGEHGGNPGGVPGGGSSSGTDPIGGGGSTGGGHWQYPVAPHSIPVNPYDTAFAAHDEVVSIVGVSHFVV
jgi:hypothetical protein